MTNTEATIRYRMVDNNTCYIIHKKRSNCYNCFITHETEGVESDKRIKPYRMNIRKDIAVKVIDGLLADKNFESSFSIYETANIYHIKKKDVV